MVPFSAAAQTDARSGNARLSFAAHDAQVSYITLDLGEDLPPDILQQFDAFQLSVSAT